MVGHDDEGVEFVVAFFTPPGKERPSGTPIWSGSLPDDATLVIYMPGRDTARLARELAEAGVAADVPCAAVSQAATARQTHAVSRLEGLAEMECGPAPLLVLVGRAMEPLLAADDETLMREILAEAVDRESPSA